MSLDPDLPALSPLDSSRFGISIGRLANFRAARADEIFAAGRALGLQMLIARCPVGDTASIHAMEAAGGRLMDTLIYYRCNLRKTDIPAELKSNPGRLYAVADRSHLAAVVQECFANYQGHYHADPRLPADQCTAGYVDWALRTCDAPAPDQHVIVCAGLDERSIGGFATLRINAGAEGEGVLFGVHPSVEGRGIYWSLMVHGMTWCKTRGASRMIVSTQLTNLTVQKAWVRLGFEPYAASHTFHLWFR